MLERLGDVLFWGWCVVASIRLLHRLGRVVGNVLRLAAAIALASWPMPVASAKECFDDTLRKNVDHGEILILSSGTIFEPLGGDRINASLWLPYSNILVCSESITYKGKSVVIYTIINTDDGEKVTARRIR